MISDEERDVVSFVALREGITMGITIFASGKIESADDIPRLIDDLKRVAGEHNWGYRVIDDDFDL
jgi:hypothetical protein